MVPGLMEDDPAIALPVELWDVADPLLAFKGPTDELREPELEAAGEVVLLLDLELTDVDDSGRSI